MTAGRSLARAGMIVTVAYLLSRILGWVRLAVMAAVFDGHVSDLDIFYAAFRLPDLIFQLVAAGALSSALLPIVAGLLARDEHARAWRVASTVTNLMLVALVILAAAVFVAAPAIMPAVTPKFDPAQLARTVELTRIMLLSPILLALGAVATSLLNAQGRFGAAAAAPLVYNLAIIAGALFLAPSMGVEGLAIGVVAGSFLHLAVQLRRLLRIGFRYEPVVRLDDPEARQALILLGPRALGLGVSQLTFLVSTSLASGLAAGSISAFNFAFTILQIPIGVIGVPLGVVIFPSMARVRATGEDGEFIGLLTRSLRLLLFVMLPITGLGIVLRRQIVALLLPTLDAAMVDATATTLLFFLVGLAAHSAIAILARAFYAGRDTRTPVAAAILAVAVNVGLAIVLVGPMGLAGLALAIAVGAWIEAVVLLAIMWRRQHGFELGGLARVLVEAGVAALAASAVAYGVVGAIDGLIGPVPGKLAILGQAIAATAAGGATFTVISLALRIPELPTIVGVMADLIRRPRRS